MTENSIEIAKVLVQDQPKKSQLKTYNKIRIIKNKIRANNHKTKNKTKKKKQ